MPSGCLPALGRPLVKSIRSTTPFVGSIAWASHSGGSPPLVEDPGYLLEVVAVAAQPPHVASIFGSVTQPNGPLRQPVTTLSWSSVFPTERVRHTAACRPADYGTGLRHTQHVDLQREHERWTSIEGKQWLVRARLHLLATKSDRISRWVELRGLEPQTFSLRRPDTQANELRRRSLHGA
jgi:hypothetical protein